MLYGIDTVDI